MKFKHTFAPFYNTNNINFNTLQMNIYVGSLSYNVDEAELRDIFEEYGEVTSAKIIIDKYSGKSKGFGFVEMPDDTEANQAIEELNGHDFKGRTIVVNKSEERKDNNRRPGGGGGSGGGGNFRKDNNNSRGRNNFRSNY